MKMYTATLLRLLSILVTVFVLGCTSSEPAGEDRYAKARALQEKAEATRMEIERQHRRGADVGEAVSLAGQVKALAQQGELDAADALLDRINALLDGAEAGAAVAGWKDRGAIELSGYAGHSMEPFLSRDGELLFFNNSNAPSENTNIHWARRTGPLTFRYQGEVGGINTRHLEGVPSMDRQGNFFFVSSRDYDRNQVSVYRGRFSNGTVTDVTPVTGISRRERGWINMDLEVSADGNRLYFTHSYFSGQPVPKKSNLALAVKDGNEFREAGNSRQIMAATHTGKLEYAPATSADELTLYWTHAGSLEGGAGFEIRRATRADRNAPFGNVETLAIFTGHFEAPTVSPDGKTILYHKLVNGRFRIHAVARTGSE